MKNLLYLLSVMLLLPLTSILSQSGYTYTGVDACVMCHKTEKQGSQLSIWESSAHSKAYETLTTDTASQIALAKGFTEPASKTWECLKCHVTGYNLDATMLGKKFKIEDGVQCETCHGPGSAYKDMKVMKDRKSAIEKGLMVHEDIEEFCVSCHNSESPTFKEFNFTEAWKLIKHDVPGKKDN